MIATLIAFYPHAERADDCHSDGEEPYFQPWMRPIESYRLGMSMDKAQWNGKIYLNAAIIALCDLFTSRQT